MEEKIELSLSKEEQTLAVDKENYFEIRYFSKIDEYFLCPVVAWIAWYCRYYLISKEDYELYLNNKEEFYKKFDAIIKLSKESYNYLVGSEALKDYCIKKDDFGFPKFLCSVWWKGFFWAKIEWEGKNYLVFPFTAKQLSNEFMKETNIKDLELNKMTIFGIEYN